MSDFGLTGDFVGTCKGVILSIAPQATVVDIDHSIPEFEVVRGAEVLQHATRYMPKDAVYLAVIDPGVGTGRRAIAVATRSGAYMTGPDNGLLIPAAAALGGISEAVLLNNQRYHIQPVSNTFHGRDIFAPAAAYLAAGTELAQLGEEVAVDSLVRVGLPGIQKESGDKVIVAEIIDIDRYGNARLSAMQDELALQYGTRLRVRIGEDEMDVRYVPTFGSSKAGDLVLVPDSHRRLSLAINKGNAAHALLLNVNTKVRLELLEEEPEPDAELDTTP